MEISDVARAAEIQAFAMQSTSLYTLLPNISEIVARLTKILSDSTCESYVYDDGAIKGFAVAGPCYDKDIANGFELWYIYVDPTAQRQGIGTKLAAYFEETALRRGHKKLCLRTLEKNAVARTFYEELGYGPDGARVFIEAVAAYQIRYFKEI